ncbi:methyltransferase [Kiloniella litopenaei]|uniref:Methyltransferase n=1 Tax=Kiloniella litopenaei TaxID=1549748 RepID=A0A0M2R988_9PROT|nr:class I SAM-dependent methyltransferase [Kiloniella litopenaei]KKJ77019.1 methyltransferase [Kiloniella litopenaei]
MSNKLSKPTCPPWFSELCGIKNLVEEQEFLINGQEFLVKNGIPRSKALFSATQKQTEEAFGFKWKKRDTFESEASLKRMRAWLNERYGTATTIPWLNGSSGSRPIVLDAGCGAAMSGLEYFSPVLDKINYLGVDVSEAADVAAARFAERGVSASFMQADISNLPFAPASLDIVFSEGVLHHTDSTENAIKSIAPLIKSGGHFMFYVYKTKGPVREFTDDYIRTQLQDMSMQEAWDAMMPLTELGNLLGELNIEIDIPREIDLLDLPSGRINLQRLFYWHVFKAFHHPDLSLEEMNHINYDWYAPANAYRQTPEEVRTWCQEAGLKVEHEVVEDAGITIIAEKQANENWIDN